MSDIISLETEFYPIERVLLVGPFADIQPFADIARAAGHTPTLLIPDEELESASSKHKILKADEAITEDDFDLVLDFHCTDLQTKAESLYYLEDALGEAMPIASLTISLSAAEISREFMIAERMIGFSILPPFAEASLAELMPNMATNKSTLKTVSRFFESVGLTVAQVNDSPGGVLVRTVCCLVNEAALALQDKIATHEEIDKAMKLGVNYPNGPLSWGDAIGLDKVVQVMDGLYAEFREERYRTTPLLKKLVRSGLVGKRAGQGFYKY